MARISRRRAVCSPPRRQRIRVVKGDFFERGVKIVRVVRVVREFKEFKEFKEFSGLYLYHP